MSARITRKLRGQTSPVFMHVASGPGLTLPQRRCDMLCASGFADDVVFSYHGTHIDGRAGTALCSSLSSVDVDVAADRVRPLRPAGSAGRLAGASDLAVRRQDSAAAWNGAWYAFRRVRHHASSEPRTWSKSAIYMNALLVGAREVFRTVLDSPSGAWPLSMGTAARARFFGWGARFSLLFPSLFLSSLSSHSLLSLISPLLPSLPLPLEV